MSDKTPRATVSVRNLSLPARRLAPGRAHADYSLWKGRMRIYPYTRVDRWELGPAVTVYRALVLENEYLEATVLPDLGGHVYSLRDRLTGEELFFRNPSFRPALVAPRGAWVAGGIEFNFPVGHSLVTVSPVDWAVEERHDGSAAVHVGHVDRVTGMRLHVSLSLAAGKRALDQQVRMINASDGPQPFFYWCNAAVESHPDTRFDFPMRRVFSDEFPRELDWPMDRGVDISLDRNNRRPSSLFALEAWGAWFGAYRESTDIGIYHWAEPGEVPGRKAWTWGSTGDGAIWHRRLSDAGTPYVEIQSGLLQNQQQFGTLAPGAALTVSECWLPVSGIGRPDWVGRAGAVRLDDQARTLRLAPAVWAAAARLELWHGADLILATVVDLDPAAPLALPVPDGNTGPLRLTLRAASGACLLEAPLGGEPRIQVLAGQEAQRVAARGAGPLCRRAAQLELANRWRDAETAWLVAHRCDPTAAEAAVGLGRMSLRRGEWANAARWAVEGAGLTGPAGRGAGESHFLLGLCLRFTGELAGAAAALRVALADPVLAGKSRVHLAALALAEGDLVGAADLAAHSGDPALQARVLRRQGLTSEAAALARKALAADPLEPSLRWEAGLGPEGLGDPVQTRQDLAAVCWREGDLDGLLSLVGKEPEELLLACWRAWALWRIGRRDWAVTVLEQAADLPLAGVFPWRSEEVQMLEALCEQMPGYGFLPALLGTYYLATERAEAGAGSLEAAQVLLPEQGPATAAVARNLALAYSRLGRLAAAARAAEQAVAADPADPQLYAEADQHLAAVGATDRRRELLAEALEQGMRETPLLLRALDFFVEQQEPDRVVALIESNHFDLIEGQLAPRCYYVAAYLMRGRERMNGGDLRGAVSDFRQARRYPDAFGIGEPERASHVQALVFEGKALAALGDAEEARRCWMQAAATAGVADETAWFGIEALRLMGDEQAATTAVEQWQREPLPEAPASRRLWLAGLKAVAAGREEEGRQLMVQADGAEAATGEDWADLLRSASELVHERRRPLVVRRVTP